MDDDHPEHLLNLCAVCAKEQVGALTVPCNHMVLCPLCAKQQACPRCMTPVASVIDISTAFQHASSATLRAKLYKALTSSALTPCLLAALAAPVHVGGLKLAPCVAVRRVIDFYEFMACKVASSDYDATMLSPSSEVDAVWHCALLHPVQYAEALAPLTGGRLIGHTMLLVDDTDDAAHDARTARRTRAVQVHAELFPTAPCHAHLSMVALKEQCATALAALEMRPLQYGVAVVDTGKQCLGAWACDDSTTVGNVLSWLENKHGIPQQHMRLLCNGRQLVSDAPLARYGIRDNTILYMVLAVRGC